MLSGPGMYYYTNYCIFILVHIRISW
jgi:hypothetical protein